MGDNDDDLKKGRNGQESEEDEPRPFINEKILRQPESKRQIARRIFLTAFCAVLFGVLSAVCFVVSKPFAEHVLGQESTQESTQITIPKDEPETTAAPQPETTEPEETAETETEALEELVRSEIKDYPYSTEELNKLYNNLRTIASDADSGLVTVHSIQHGTDWFNNPIETTGQFSGVVISKLRREILILTPDQAVTGADSIDVAFADGTVVPGEVKQTDSVMGLAVISVKISQMDEAAAEKVTAIELGNSYSVKRGDMVVAVGAPAGIVRSSDYGFISYVIRNVQTIDGITRIFYASTHGDAQAGTFLLNTSGEIVGWATDRYTDGSSIMTTVVGISDYKGILEMLSNGISAPYMGIRGQEVGSAMEESGITQGIYITEVIADSPAYEAGIQPGDVLTVMNGEETDSMKNFQNQMEKIHVGDKAEATVLRSNSRGEYKEIKFEVTIGAR
jgi:S1-C subfamily serine protease